MILSPNGVHVYEIIVLFLLYSLFAIPYRKLRPNNKRRVNENSIEKSSSIISHGTYKLI